MIAHAAARKLYERHQEWALSIAGSALRRIGPQADGEEIRQVARAKTWEKALAFNPRLWTIRPAGEPFQIYAYPSVYGACLMVGLRGVSGRARTSDGEWVGFSPIEEAEDAPVCGGQCQIDRAIDGDVKKRLVLAILAELPKRERHLIAEHYLGGVSLAAIAESLYTSPSSVSRIHANALNLLRVAVTRRGIRAGEWL